MSVPAPTPAAVPPEVVVFDLGKVLLEFDYGLAARALAPASLRDAAHIRQVLDQSPLLHRLESGQLDEEGFEQEVRQETGYSGTRDDFRRHFGDIFSEVPEMIALHAQLKRHGVRTVLFSNTNGLAVDHIRSRYPVFSEFDGWVLSYQAGAMKPDARAYQAVESLTGCAGPSLLYVDDRPENIEAGRRRGWRTILHQAPAVTRDAVRRQFPALSSVWE
ncbi:MAG: HAD family phosphatase [Verrucomicrobia bacterium]|nr:HAD family phosphatase [Verrucomicrobiota bacterium]